MAQNYATRVTDIIDERFMTATYSPMKRRRKEWEQIVYTKLNNFMVQNYIVLACLIAIPVILIFWR